MLGQSAGQRSAALDGFPESIDGAADDLVRHHVAHDCQRAEHGHAALQHRAERACEPRRLDLHDERADVRHAEERAVPLEPSLRAARPDPPGEDTGEDDDRAHPPVLAQRAADGHEDLRGERDRLFEIREDRGEAGDDERQQEDDGGASHGRDHQRIGQRREDGLGERRSRFEELGEPAQRDLEDAALLTRAHHVDVEA